MPGILRVNKDSATALIITGASSVFVDGYKVSVIGSQEDSIPIYTMIHGSSTVFADEIAVCRNGDVDSNGIAGSPGSSDVFAG